MRKATRNLLFDRLHRGAVYTCLGLTLYGSYLLAGRVYRYFTVIKPARIQSELRMIDEGSIDNTPNVKA